MNTKIFTTFPQDAKDIRIEVFVKEQGFKNEFDEIDTISHHIFVFDEGKPIGTCRFFKENDHYTIGSCTSSPSASMPVSVIGICTFCPAATCASTSDGVGAALLDASF